VERPYIFYRTGIALLLLGFFLVADVVAAFFLAFFRPNLLLLLVPLVVVSGIIPTLVDRRLSRRDETVSEFRDGEDKDGD
jgi:hypothetical protein